MGLFNTTCRSCSASSAMEPTSASWPRHQDQVGPLARVGELTVYCFSSLNATEVTHPRAPLSSVTSHISPSFLPVGKSFVPVSTTRMAVERLLGFSYIVPVRVMTTVSLPPSAAGSADTPPI